MKKIYVILIIALASLSISGCISFSSGTKTKKETPVVQKGAQLYTQINMWSEKGVVQPINHTKGVLIPVNTPVIIEGISRSQIKFHYANSPKVVITVNNHPDYTGVDIRSYGDRLFGAEPQELSGFTPQERAFIQNYNGTWVQGLSKEAVIIGRGYPPAHRTNTTDLDTWRYWNSRWDSFRLAFKNGRTYTINEELIGSSEDTDSQPQSVGDNISSVSYRHGIEAIPWFGFSWYVTGSGKVVAVNIESDVPASNHILQGDQIIRVNDTDIHSVQDILYALYDLFPGQNIECTIERNGELIDVSFASVTKDIVSHVNYIMKECIAQEDVKIAIIIDQVEFADLHTAGNSNESIESWENTARLNLMSIEENLLLGEFRGLPNFHIVDRSHIDEVLEEQKISLTGLFAQASSIGQLLDASHIMFVSMSREAKDNSDSYEDVVSERLVDVETGKVVSTSLKVYENMIENNPQEEDSSFLGKIWGLFSDE